MEVREPRTDANNPQAHRPLSRHQEATDEIPAHATTATLKLRTPPRQSAAPPQPITNPPLEELCQILFPSEPRHLRTTQAVLTKQIKVFPSKTIRQVPLHQTQTHHRLPSTHSPIRLPPAAATRGRRRHLLAARLTPDIMPQCQGLCLGLPHARGRRRQAAAPAGRHLRARRGAARRAGQRPRRERRRWRGSAADRLCRAFDGRGAR